MSEVFVYDDALTPVTSPLIQIVENDSRSVIVEVKANTAQPGGLYGAIMKQPSPMGPVSLWVDDTGGTYAPTGFEFLNPGPSLRLDVSLFPLPAPVGAGGTGGGGGSGGHGSPSPRDPHDPTAQSAQWTHEESKGVSRLMATVAMARLVIDPEIDFMVRLHRWENWLEMLGIDLPRARGGQGSGGAVPFNPVIHIPGAYLGQGNVYRIPMEER